MDLIFTCFWHDSEQLGEKNHIFSYFVSFPKQNDCARQFPTVFDAMKLVVQVSYNDEDEENKDWVTLKVTVFQSEKIEPKRKNGWKWVIIYNIGWVIRIQLD